MNVENVVLRALVGDPTRHKPLADHQPLRKTAGEEKEPAAMYTLETRYRPIPRKVLPPAAVASHVLYHIEPQQTGQQTPPIIRHGQCRSSPLGNNLLLLFVLVEPDTPPPPVAEPKIISTPVLYAIVAKKAYPTGIMEPVQSQIARFLIYLSDKGCCFISVAVEEPPELIKPTIEKTPILYSLIARPRLQVQIQEPIKETVQPPPAQETSASLYSIVGGPELTADTRNMSSDVPEEAPPPPPVLVKKKSNEVAMYSIIGGPQIPQKIPITRKARSLDAQPSKAPETPTLYTIVSKPRSPASVNLDSRPK